MARMELNLFGPTLSFGLPIVSFMLVDVGVVSGVGGCRVEQATSTLTDDKIEELSFTLGQTVCPDLEQ